MNQRLLLVSLLIALVTSAGGYLLVTAVCADSGTAEMACHQVNQPSRDGRSAMRHKSRTTDFAEAAMGGEQPFENCCISHPNLPQSAFALGQAEAPRSSTQVEAPEAIASVSYVVLTPPRISAREHAPPGRSSPLHVRINVFRI